VSSSISSFVGRCQRLNQAAEVSDSKSVVYLMSRDQRLHDNHALLYAQQQAQKQKLPLSIIFALYSSSGQRAKEHYEFMLSGLRDLAEEAANYNISFLLVSRDDLETKLDALRPAILCFDFSPLRGSKSLQQKLASKNVFPCVQIDTHNLIPIWQASDKQEYAARTLRSKIHRKLPEFLMEPPTLQAHSYGEASIEIDEKAVKSALSNLRSNGQMLSWKSGETAAQQVLSNFISRRLNGYAEQRNNPSLDGLSGLSPYLHFGQLSSLRVALEVQSHTDIATSADRDALLEELIVRKELSDNYCYHNPHYDSLAGAPDWAKQTLAKHANDPRDFLYSLEQLEKAQTHDEAWNASQRQLVRTGKMHGYMRMYWAKKVLEWTESAEQAHQFLVFLNDFYSIDGGDPNGYVGILWSIAGLHDRPWFERPVYGTVRYMNENGLKRKFKLANYITAYSA
jgi:deoxyribodipyrimidine photo-lyase